LIVAQYEVSAIGIFYEIGCIGGSSVQPIELSTVWTIASDRKIQFNPFTVK
jgi:hypothetical protein